jgi:hypothetical protein
MVPSMNQEVYSAAERQKPNLLTSQAIWPHPGAAIKRGDHFLQVDLNQDFPGLGSTAPGAPGPFLDRRFVLAYLLKARRSSPHNPGGSHGH